jgi:hypothetical protein
VPGEPKRQPKISKRKEFGVFAFCGRTEIRLKPGNNYWRGSNKLVTFFDCDILPIILYIFGPDPGEGL